MSKIWVILSLSWLSVLCNNKITKCFHLFPLIIYRIMHHHTEHAKLISKFRCKCSVLKGCQTYPHLFSLQPVSATHPVLHTHLHISLVTCRTVYTWRKCRLWIRLSDHHPCIIRYVYFPLFPRLKRHHQSESPHKRIS